MKKYIKIGFWFENLKGGDLEVDVSKTLRYIKAMEFEGLTRFVWFGY
jgi:hypothetical protein